MYSSLSEAERFLVSREIHPDRAREAWNLGSAASLEAGKHFDAICLRVVTALHGVPIKDGAAIENRFRAFGITSSVFTARDRLVYYVLVPPGTDESWQAPETTCHGRRSGALRYVKVPHPSREAGPGAHWVLPAPTGPEMLCDPECVKALLASAAAK
ncbi:hypothetical protein [Streptomyces abikoensis]|uniref:hypothetical protein n=1 Tax=Streptomyces abikoensis TaxID=97398 RepID=UPI00167815D0|nr:hypothetical protein [Streptomyces abikoensis]